MTSSRWARTLLCGLWLVGPCVAAEWFVAPDGSPAGVGTRASPWPLSQANSEVRPGDTVKLLPGRYATVLAPARSGTPEQPITFEAVERHRAILGAGPEAKAAAIDLSRRSHIVVDGVAVFDVRRFVLALGSHHLTIQNGWFENGLGWESCRFRESGDGIRLFNNLFRNGTDLVSIEGGQYHQIEGNVFETANHSCLTLMAVDRSVVRHNTFRNDLMKLVEVFSGRQGRPTEGRPTQRTLFEHNHFAYTADYTRQGSSSVSMTLSGKQVIVRHNLITDCQAGLYLFLNTGNIESNICQGNRIYHNVIYDCGHGGAFKYNGLAFVACGTGAAFGDNEAVNNVVFQNRHAEGYHFRGFPPTTQLGYQSGALPGDLRLHHNVIRCEGPNEPVIASITSGRQSYTLADFERRYPKAAAGNLDCDPEFVDVARLDFSLRATSPCIDAGRPLTTASGDGQGTVLPVADTSWFCDGYGLIAGDVIRVGDQRATVVAVDEAASTLRLQESIRWRAGEGVSLDYLGSAPDIGLAEHGAGRRVQPGSTLRVGRSPGIDGGGR